METIRNTFVLVAPDCPVTSSVAPVAKGAKPLLHVIYYAALTARPYTLTLEDLIFEAHVQRAGIARAEFDGRAAEIRSEISRKPQACMRASALPKRYGWGVHYDSEGRLALYAMESDDYRRFAAGEVKGVKIVQAFRGRRAEAPPERPPPERPPRAARPDT